MIYQNITKEQLVRIVTEAVAEELRRRGSSRQVPAGIAARHIHLSTADVERLFGRGYVLTPKKDLTQPGQYACEECLDVIGPKGELKRVRVLGPARNATQVELSQTDCRTIGVKAPLRSSGDLQGSPGVVLRGPKGEYSLSSGVIVADRHLHMSALEAAAFGLTDGDRVSVRIDGPKPGIMGNVLVRAGKGHSLDFHIDTDDANAFLLSQGQLVTVLDKEE